MSIASSPEQISSPFPASLIRHPGLQMALATFAILVLELALIRWVGSQIRIAAYFTNLVLIAAFLGMGLGVALGQRRPKLFRMVFPALALLVGVLSLAEPLQFVNMRFPDPAVSLWGGESNGSSISQTLIALIALLSCFWAIALVFVCAGIPVGVLFARMPALSAYRWDLAGSLLGVIVMSIIAWLGATPPIWFGLGLLALLTLDRRPLNWIFAAIIVAASAWSAGYAVFSPYNRIDIHKAEMGLDHSPQYVPAEWDVSVNRDYHQFMLDLRSWPEQVTNLGERTRSRIAAIYETPFKLTDLKDSALVVGAGTGNDVAAALRSGFKRVVSVDIDPRIIELGREMHPEHPYSDPRVVPVVNDARAYFQQNRDEKFDVICYGLLDSHAMFSAMSSLRLDNYVYTREGIAAGWSHVKDHGVMTVSFSVFAGKWMMDRFFRMVREATGLTPYIVAHRYNVGATFVVGRDLTLDRVRSAFPEILVDYAGDDSVRVPTDDWPFLYIRPNTLPTAYLAVLSLICITALLALRRVFGARAFRAESFDLQAFLLGAAFMLLETRMVTALSLLFGSTWIVNSSVFGGILLMVLLANAVAEKFKPCRVELWYGPLVLSMVAIWLSSTGALNTLPLVERVIAAGLLYSLPMFFAGVIFSSLLQRRNDTGATLGSNLCGAVMGGLLEYLSTVVGMKAIVLLALAIYLASALAHARGKSLNQVQPA
jgi:predicted RNA methylase